MKFENKKLAGLLGIMTVWASWHVAASSFSLPPDFERLSASSKQALLWSRISASPYAAEQLKLKGPGVLDLLKAADPCFMAAAFLNPGDEMAEGRVKLIHSNGAVVKVRWVPSPNSFTGIFQSGALGLARLSIASPSTSNYIPGMALKLMINGEASTNLVAMYSLDGQGSDRDFFAHSFSTVVALPKSRVLKIGAALFRKALRRVPNAPENERTIPLTEMASVENDATKAAPIRAPYRLIFAPTSSVRNEFASAGLDSDFRVGVQAIRENSVLYTILAVEAPGAEAVQVGQLITESEFVASQYGDEKLYFRHPQELRRQ